MRHSQVVTVLLKYCCKKQSEQIAMQLSVCEATGEAV